MTALTPVVLEKLAFPLILGPAIAAFGWFFGPHLTNAWQDREHQFATKSALADELSQASAQLMSAVQTREFDRATETDTAFLAAYRSWDEQSQVIDAKIATRRGRAGVGGALARIRRRDLSPTFRMKRARGSARGETPSDHALRRVEPSPSGPAITSG